MEAILVYYVSGTAYQVSETVLLSATFIIDCVPELDFYAARKTVLYATARLLLRTDD